MDLVAFHVRRQSVEEEHRESSIALSRAVKPITPAFRSTRYPEKKTKIEVSSVTDRRARFRLRQRGESLEKTNRFSKNTDKPCFRVCLRCRWTLRRGRFAGTTINRTPWRILDKIVPSLPCVGLANYPTFFVESCDPRQRGCNLPEIVAVVNCEAIGSRGFVDRVGGM